MSERICGADNTDFVEKLFAAGIIKSRKVARVMSAVDRANYCKRGDPYVDCPQSIGHNVTISAPHMHAVALDLLEHHLKPGSKVLDVGVGSGYLVGCMALMVGDTGSVLGIDVVEPLVALAEENLRHDGKFPNDRVKLRVGDGWEGDSNDGPFDVIHVGAAAETIPKPLVEQLAPGGRMIIPVGRQGGPQYLMQVDKSLDGSISSKNICGVRYVPLVKN